MGTAREFRIGFAPCMIAVPSRTATKYDSQADHSATSGPCNRV